MHWRVIGGRALVDARLASMCFQSIFVRRTGCNVSVIITFVLALSFKTIYLAGCPPQAVRCRLSGRRCSSRRRRRRRATCGSGRHGWASDWNRRHAPVGRVLRLLIRAEIRTPFARRRCAWRPRVVRPIGLRIRQFIAGFRARTWRAHRRWWRHRSSFGRSAYQSRHKTPTRVAP